MFRISMVIYPGRIDSFRKSFRSVGSSKRRTNKPEMEKFMAMAIRKEAISELDKAKYTRRWRGKDGRYQYEYGSQTSRSPRMMTSQEVDAARDRVAGIQRGRARLSSFQDEPIRPSVISTKGHNELNNAVSALSGDSYRTIPIQKINAALRKEGYVLLQPGDGREWPKNKPFFEPGKKIKSKGWDVLPIGNLSLSGENGLGQKTYIGMGSTQLKLKWSRQSDGTFKVNASMTGPFNES